MEIFNLNERETLGKRKQAFCSAAIAADIGGLYFLLGLGVELAVYGVLTTFLILLSFYDMAIFELPDLILGVMAVAGVLVLPINPFVTWYTALAGAAGVGGILIFLSVVSKGQIGMGDGKLFAVIGLYLGFKGAFMVLLYALFISGIAGLVMIAMRRATRKTAIPFAPFVIVSVFIELLLKF